MKFTRGLLSGALFFASSFALSHESDRTSFGIYDENLMASAGTAYLGSAGNSSLNPAGLAFIKNTERYHSVLLVSNFRGHGNGSLDNELLFIPSFVAKSFRFADGVMQPYFGSYQITASLNVVEDNVEYSFLSETRGYRGGLGYGRNWDNFAAGLGVYLQGNSNRSFVNSEFKQPGVHVITSNSTESQTYVLGAVLGLAQQFDNWSWGVRVSPAPALLINDSKSTGKIYDLINNTTVPVSASDDAILRVPYIIAGTSVRVSDNYILLTDVGYLFPKSGNDSINEVDYSGAFDLKMGLRKELANDQQLFAGLGFETQNTDSKSSNHEAEVYKVTGGYKHRIKTSHGLYGFAYSQDKLGDSRSISIVFGSDFSL